MLKSASSDCEKSEKFGGAAQAGAGVGRSGGGGVLKDACRVQSGAREGEIVRWAAVLSAEVMAEWWRYLSCAATRPSRQPGH